MVRRKQGRQQLPSDLKSLRSLANIFSNIFLLLEKKLHFLDVRLSLVIHVIALKSSQVLVLQLNTGKQYCPWALHYFLGF